MSTLRRLLAVGAFAALVLTGAGKAQAATQQEIYRDLADNGRLDGRYSRAEIQRAFTVTPVVRSLPRKPIGEHRDDQAAGPAAKRAEKRPLPFTALDAALLAAGAAPLLLIGVRLRRKLAARRRPSEATVVSG